MCGFVAAIGSMSNSELFTDSADSISYRGPDQTTYEKVSETVHMVFHRLAIMDQSSAGSQPMAHPDDANITLVCNGEIYNYSQLADEFDITMNSKSDCEIILHLYKIMPMEQLLNKLDGVFAFVLSDSSAGTVYAARDPFGVRPMFVGHKGGSTFFSSECKAISNLCDDVNHFYPGTYWSSDTDATYTYYKNSYGRIKSLDEDSICGKVRDSLESAVIKRLTSDREIGCLLSGGLDSSLIAALVQKNIGEYGIGSSGLLKTKIPRRVKTFSIGMEGSPDLEYAKKVALWIGSDHNEVKLSPEDFLNAVEEVIYKIESYDTTTVRASIGNYLVSKYIKDNTDCKVVFNGDGADEVCAGYVYKKNAPSPKALQRELVRLTGDIHHFDVLRSDRSISSNGLEPRTPFLDKQFVRYYMSISPEIKQFDKINTIEKRLLRKAFAGTGLLPESVLWRDKCAFSDGVSSARSSWHKILQDHVDSIISDEEFEREAPLIKHCTPLLKESLYYRKVFRGLFPGMDHLVPYFWMPKWTDVIDPSARELSGYKE
jgi:asparagine synthase (glutamine-hydrolysing)